VIIDPVKGQTSEKSPMHSSSVAGREIFVSHNSGRVTANPSVTKPLLADGRRSNQNSEDRADSRLETRIGLLAIAEK
jgi:hypothetical protein